MWCVPVITWVFFCHLLFVVNDDDIVDDIVADMRIFFRDVLVE